MTEQTQSKSTDADNPKVYLIAAALGAGVGLVSIAFLFAVLSLKNLIWTSDHARTSAIVVFGICMWGIQNYLKTSKKNVMVIVLGSMICLSLFLISNPVLRGLFLNSSSGIS
jgi:hypothetical protein